MSERKGRDASLTVFAIGELLLIDCGARERAAADRSYLGFFLLSGDWLSADAATLFTAFGVFELLSNFDAFEATLFDVFSFFPTMNLP